MAEIKAFILVYNIFGFSLSAYTLYLSFANVDLLTRSILCVLSMAFLAVKIVSAALNTYRKHKSEMIDIRQKNIDIRRKELELYDDETRLIEKYKT